MIIMICSNCGNQIMQNEEGQKYVISCDGCNSFNLKQLKKNDEYNYISKRY